MLDLHYENIDVYHCERFVAMGFKPDFWFGSIQGWFVIIILYALMLGSADDVASCGLLHRLG